MLIAKVNRYTNNNNKSCPKAKYKLTDVDSVAHLIQFMKSELRKDGYRPRRGLSNKLGGLISQYKQHFRRHAIDDYVQIQNRLLQLYDNTEDYGYIYFIGNLDQGCVKIGYSKKVNQRLRSLQTGSPIKLKIIKKIKGNRSKERKLHKRFAHLNKHGEWFNIDKELREYLHHDNY